MEASSTAMRSWRSDAGLAAQRCGLFGVLVRTGKFLPEALEAAKAVRGQPQLICCNTILGKGVSFMENVPLWHGVAPDAAQSKAALSELGLA